MYYKSGHGILCMIFLHIQAVVFHFQPFFQQSPLIDLLVQHLFLNHFLVCYGQPLVGVWRHS